MRPVETMTDAEVREELAAEGVDLDAAKARFETKLDDLMAKRAQRKALAAISALRAHPPSPENPFPWRADDLFVRDARGDRVAQWVEPETAEWIAACSVAAPVLAAEVERLQGLLDAAKEAVDVWPAPAHSFYCGYWRGPEGYDSRLCDCDVEQRRGDRAHARRAVGLEEGK